MRLKGQKSQGRGGNKQQRLGGGAGSAAMTSSDMMNGGGGGGGSSASCSSASAIGAHDDLDNCMDSGDDEIDVGTNADSMGFNGGQPSTSAALSGIQNDHPFGGGVSSMNSPNPPMSDSAMSSGGGGGGGAYSQPHSVLSSFRELSEADRKRAHHNALERKRRDHIKDSFHCLRDAIPNIKGEKVSRTTSRAQILKAATDYIRQMRNRNNEYQNDIDILKKQNNDIEMQIKALEDARKSAAELLKSLNKPGAKTTTTTSRIITSSMMSSGGGGGGLSIKNEPGVSSTSMLTSSGGVATSAAPSTTTTTTTTTTSMQSLLPPSSSLLSSPANNVLVLTKPSSSNVPGVLTSVSSDAANAASANAKKFKTIINPKNNLNFINLNTTTTATTTSSAGKTTTAPHITTIATSSSAAAAAAAAAAHAAAVINNNINKNIL